MLIYVIKITQKFVHFSLRRCFKDTLDNVVVIIIDFKVSSTSRHFIFSLTHFSGFGMIVIFVIRNN